MVYSMIELQKSLQERKTVEIVEPKPKPKPKGKSLKDSVSSALKESKEAVDALTEVQEKMGEKK